MGGGTGEELIHPSGPSVGFEAERNSALMMGILHWCAVVAAFMLIWDSPLIDNRLVTLWCISQLALGATSLGLASNLQRGQLGLYAQRARAQTFFTSLTFGALPWLGSDFAGADESKHLLFMAAMAFTAVSAINSAQITSSRPFFWWHLVVVACSYSLAYGARAS